MTVKNNHPRSPLAPARFPDLPPVAGVEAAVLEAAFKYAGRTDLLVVRLREGTALAGVLTRSKTASPAVDWCRGAIASGQARGLIVTAGNANAFTGRYGRDAVERSARALAALLGCAPQAVTIAQTGVIGEPFPPDRLIDRLPQAVEGFAPPDWEAAASAIMTTDTFPKGSGAIGRIGNTPFAISGIAKGSGMIAPDMATMLSFIFTDAAIAPAVLHNLLSEAVEASFNAITVDSDTSTSDTVLLFATGQAATSPVDDIDDPMLDEFRTALNQVCRDLAHQVVRDGEGASKFVSVTVEGAEDDRAAKTVALSIANSPLVKTAIAGEDANWGRVVMAVGKAGEAADRDRLAIRFGPHLLAKNGLRVEEYSEEAVSSYMKGCDIDIHVDLGIDDGRATVWTCDLTHGYISINGDYRS